MGKRKNVNSHVTYTCTEYFWKNKQETDTALAASREKWVPERQGGGGRFHNLLFGTLKFLNHISVLLVNKIKIKTLFFKSCEITCHRNTRCSELEKASPFDLSFVCE